MKLPNSENARVPKAKIADYLLSPTHRSGRSKAGFFSRFGFQRDRWEQLAEALRQHATANPVTESEATRFGRRYVIDGILRAPDGTDLNVRVAWFIDTGKNEPRFVTAHPLGKRR